MAFSKFMNGGACRNTMGRKEILYLCGHVFQTIALSVMRGVPNNQSVGRCLAGTLQNVPSRFHCWPLSFADWALGSDSSQISLGTKNIIKLSPCMISIFVFMATVSMSIEQAPI